jgi:hypothetical protein
MDEFVFIHDCVDIMPRQRLGRGCWIVYLGLGKREMLRGSNGWVSQWGRRENRVRELSDV